MSHLDLLGEGKSVFSSRMTLSISTTAGQASCSEVVGKHSGLHRLGGVYTHTFISLQYGGLDLFPSLLLFFGCVFSLFS